MKIKPDLSFWKLWNLSFGFFGVQIAYALQSANVSRIFTTIGADPHDLSYFWILPPLMGLLVQPIVGMMSDRTWNRFGRRLPYLIFGATIAVVVMCLLPNAGSFQFIVASAILFGLIALMLLTRQSTWQCSHLRCSLAIWSTRNRKVWHIPYKVSYAMPVL